MFNKSKRQLFSGKSSDSFNSITLGLLSPEEILERSHGEVLKPETINYRSYKPEKDGLFCEKIFGPVKDWECHCGKYKRIRYRGIVCDRCGVEVTRKSVRRERIGHLNLAVPVVHIWYLRSIPSKISYLLGYTTRQLENIVYYEKYVITNPGKSGRKYGELIDEDEFLDLDDEFGIDVASDEDIDNDEFFVGMMGGAAIKELLSNLDVSETIAELLALINGDKTSTAKKEESLKRLRILKKFDPKKEKKIYNKPEWMVLSVLPIIPPELRPLVPLEGGRFAASDLNDLYRRVIIRNNRLKQLLEIKAPDVILRNEKRMLQEAVDSLFDNSRMQSAVRSGTRRPLKSLSDALKGKTGRFRQNLLGKRVDYSGRSVIVVGPELKLHECGLPKAMAMELFKPKIINELIKRGYTKTPKSAKMMVDSKHENVYNVLEYAISNHPVLLNRAPTLHRLGIQAFQPVLIDGRAIRLHPLVCAAFNADFDGDQMAVHVPLSTEAQTEAWMLMLASHNILHPAHGKPIAIPSQDMVLGCYYLTKMRKDELGAGMKFGSYEEVKLALENKLVSLHADVDFKINNQWINNTTVGRILFNEIMPDIIPFVNELLDRKKIEKLVSESYEIAGNYETVQFLDKLKDLGFYQAYQSGLSIAINDIHIPDNKEKILLEADGEVKDIQAKFDKRILTEGERYNKVIDIWTHATSQIAQEMFKELKNDNQGFNPLFMMADSGARGSQDQIKQLAGMRGLMAKPKKSMVGSAGEIIENPIKSNFKEGLSAFEYFISTHGARKGLADTALKTADAGYLTRRLVDVAQDVVVNQEDCGTKLGLVMEDFMDGEEVIESLEERVIGRFSLDPVKDPESGKVLISKNTLIGKKELDKIAKYNIVKVKIRSVLTCESYRGVCASCYGVNLANQSNAKVGDAVGVIAAQSIGEPGTQLTLRTFHIGGTASRIVEQSQKFSKKKGVIKFSDNFQTIDSEDENGSKIQVSQTRNGEMSLFDNKKVHLITWKVPYGSTIHCKNNQKINIGDLLFSWDPYTDVILARSNGKIIFKDFVEGETYSEEAVEGGKKMVVITESKDRNLNPHLEIHDKKGKLVLGGSTILPVKATVVVKDGENVKIGQILVKIPRDAAKTRDITGGLPRIAELFEARNPQNPAVATEIDGNISFGNIKRGIREIVVTNKDNKKTYKIPYGKHIIVHDGDFVFAGDRLCEGSISPKDILKISGSAKAQEYLVNSIQEVYRLQGVKINDKHIEIIVRQMMQKVEIVDPGDSQFLMGDRINKSLFRNEIKELKDKVVVVNPGDSDYETNDVVYKGNIADVNSELKDKDKKIIKFRKAKPATSNPLLLGITRASLNTDSFISAASFQETTRVLTDASVENKTDNLLGLKENVIIGRLIPAGTGSGGFSNNLIVKNNSDELVAEQEEESPVEP